MGQSVWTTKDINLASTENFRKLGVAHKCWPVKNGQMIRSTSRFGTFSFVSEKTQMSNEQYPSHPIDTISPYLEDHPT